MYCQKCGCEIKPDQKFCSNCGEAVLVNQVPEKKSALTGKAMIIVAGICLFLAALAVIKLLGKSDEERLIGTWELVEEVYGGSQVTENIGTQAIFCEDGQLYDDEGILRAHHDTRLISWSLAEDSKTLIFTDSLAYRLLAKYELNGKRLKVIDENGTYSIWEKQ